MKEKAILTCLSSECPERFSLCCKAHCRSASEPERMLGVPAYFCSKCGKEWKAPACTARERNRENSAWNKRFDAKFPKSRHTSDIYPRDELKAFIENEIMLAQLDMIKELRDN